MKLFNYKRRVNINKYKYLLVVLLIIIITIIFLKTTLRKASNNMLSISKSIINTINTNGVNNNIKIDILKKYNMNNLIEVVYKDNKINDINFDLEKAYELLIDIKKGIINSISQNMDNIYNYKYVIRNNIILIEMPFYNYTNNILLANLGPKIECQLSIIKLIDCNIRTIVKTYGINSLLIELYINFNITNSIVVPNYNEDYINNYEILISSKVIQGEIPSIYNGVYEQSSNNISY